MGLYTKILSLSILETELLAKCNSTNFDGGNFDNGAPQVVHPNLVMGGIHFSCSDKSQEHNKIGLIRSRGERGGGGLSGPWTILNQL